MEIICTILLMTQAGISTNGLTPVDVAELQLQAAEMQETNETIIPTATRLKEYADSGQAIAVALGSCAEELGIAVDEFSRTPVGKVTIFILAWKLIGREMLGLLIGGLFLICASWIWSYYFRKLCVVQEIQYDDKGKKSKVVHYKTVDGCMPDFVIAHRVFMALIILAIWVSGLMIIFMC